MAFLLAFPSPNLVFMLRTPYANSPQLGSVFAL